MQKTNPTTGETWFYTYSLNNQMLSAEQHSSDNSLAATLEQRIVYVYDVFGDLISETATPHTGPGTATRYAYDVSGASIGIDATVNPEWAELNAGGAVVERFFRDASGDKLARTGAATNGTAWLLTDRQGSVRDVLNASGTLEDTIAYSAVGQTTTETNAALVTGRNPPFGVALDAVGNLYVSDDNTGTIGEYSASTGIAINANWVTGLGDPAGIAIALVPEPSSFILLGMVCGFGCVAYRWRKRNQVFCVSNRTGIETTRALGICLGLLSFHWQRRGDCLIPRAD